MSDNLRATPAYGAPPREAIARNIDLGDIPSLPLALAADMPAHAGFPRGSLAVTLGGLQLSIADTGTPAPEIGRDTRGRRVVTIRVRNIALSGRHTLQGKRIWESGIDGAGTGRPIGNGRIGGADKNAHPIWIANANAQRAPLQDVPGGNGAELLSTYSDHRAALNDVFTLPTGYAFQMGWGVPEITEMAEDTNAAVIKGGVVVNDPNKTYGSTTYNGNAQNQQLALLTTLIAFAGATNPSDPQDPTNPYNQAAAATLTFGSSIMQNTGSQKINDVPPQTKEGVYGLVESGQPATRHTVRDVHAFIAGDPIGGRDALGKSWTMCLNEDERAFVRKMQADIAGHLERIATEKPVALASGTLSALLDCDVIMLFDDGEDGQPRLLDGRVELDGFDLDIDDHEWDQALGPDLADKAREALGEARFIKSLLHDRVADALERELVQPLSRMAMRTVS